MSLLTIAQRRAEQEAQAEVVQARAKERQDSRLLLFLLMNALDTLEIPNGQHSIKGTGQVTYTIDGIKFGVRDGQLAVWAFDDDGDFDWYWHQLDSISDLARLTFQEATQ